MSRPILFVVATPIGNLEDITLRALRILKEVDFIVCEDTRITLKLLTHYQIKKPLISYFQHSRFQRLEEIISRLKKGEKAALVTDAGTPAISDPGGQLIQEALKRLENLVISPIPGPSALTSALSISGFPADRFLFLGFPPHKKGRQKFWQRVLEAQETVVFYESPHRILKSLEELRQKWKLSKPRTLKAQIVVCRELTKVFESVYRGSIEEVLEKIRSEPVKGEYVVVFSPFLFKHCQPQETSF
jgi:16S rRNA (cytidine1402-2'-O)-methyltransferase